VPTIFKHIDDESLYEQLVSRIYHVERAFIVRRHIKLHYAEIMPNDVKTGYARVRSRYNEFFSTFEESLMWFITVELWSRFTANSDRGLRKLVNTLNDNSLNQQHRLFKENHSDVIGFIETQRHRYFAHADTKAKWKKFPNIWDKEYEALIRDIKDLLQVIGENTGSSRRPSNVSKAKKDTCNIFDDLLTVEAPELDSDLLSKEYDNAVRDFLKS